MGLVVAPEKNSAKHSNSNVAGKHGFEKTNQASSTKAGFKRRLGFYP